MAVPFANRMAGKYLYDFLRTAGSVVSGSVEQAVLNKLGSMENATGLIGVAAKYPKTTAKMLGKATPLGLAGGAAGLTAGIGYLMQPRQQSDYSLPVHSSPAPRQTAFATSQYIPGASPLTNEQMGEALLNQQRYQHQLELIQARQAASTNMGSLQGGSSTSDILGLAQRIYG